jgi:hypothetical protein
VQCVAAAPPHTCVAPLDPSHCTARPSLATSVWRLSASIVWCAAAPALCSPHRPPRIPSPQRTARSDRRVTRSSFGRRRAPQDWAFMPLICIRCRQPSPAQVYDIVIAVLQRQWPTRYAVLRSASPLWSASRGRLMRDHAVTRPGRARRATLPAGGQNPSCYIGQGVAGGSAQWDRPDGW